MNKVAYTAFVVFVTAILTLVTTHFLSKTSTPVPGRSPTSMEVTPSAQSNSEDQLQDKRVIPLAELAQHNKIDDCWMAIRGKVYNVTSYIPTHPTRSTLFNEWCGKDATEGWNTKGYGRPHSPTANARLSGCFIGVLAE